MCITVDVQNILISSLISSSMGYIHNRSITSDVKNTPFTMFSSLRTRIIVLFLLSFVFSGGALLYALGQFQRIGKGLYTINACYLPVSDETTKLDLIVFQLQREQERLTPIPSQQEFQFLNAEFYIEELSMGLDRTITIIELAEKSDIVDTPSDLHSLRDKANQTKDTLTHYRSTWLTWKSDQTDLQALNKAKSQLVVAIRQLASTVSVQMIQVSQQTELSRRNAQRLSGTLTVLATFLWMGLLYMALRVVQPITKLTEQVQKVRQGEMVTITERGISSEISELYTEFNEMAKTIQQRDRTQRLATIGKMLAQITHEIRNPLNAMSLNVEMLMEEPLSEDGQEMLDILKTEIDRLEQSTGHYLSLARPPEVRRHLIRPENIIQPLIQHEHYAVQFIVTGESHNVLMDEDILRRCLRNLFRNAQEAEATTIWLTLDSNMITIQDNGHGFSSEHRHSAFEPFYTTKSHGTGLGLSICRQELELCGATLSLDKTQGKTTFVIICAQES